MAKPDADDLEEIAVADADPATLKIYQQIMAQTGVGSPALIYRHLAVTPGLLAWVWTLFGPEVESGHARVHALSAVKRVPPLSLPRIGESDFNAVGVDAEGRAMIGAILATYNRMNPVNLAIIGALRRLLGGNAGLPETLAETAVAARPRPAPSLPAPIKVADMPPDLQACVADLSGQIPSLGGTVTPTLYRHLAHWPMFLMQIAPPLLIEMRGGGVDQRMSLIETEMRPLIADLASRAGARMLDRLLTTVPHPDVQTLLTTLDSFLFTIPQLIVVGTAIDAAIKNGGR